MPAQHHSHWLVWNGPSRPFGRRTGRLTARWCPANGPPSARAIEFALNDLAPAILEMGRTSVSIELVLSARGRGALSVSGSSSGEVVAGSRRTCRNALASAQWAMSRPDLTPAFGPRVLPPTCRLVATRQIDHVVEVPDVIPVKSPQKRGVDR